MARVALCALVLVLAAACGNDAGTDEGTDEGPAESVPAQGEPEPAPAEITEEQSGGVFTLAAGGETSLRLSSEWTWSEPVIAGDAVQLQQVNYLQDPGFVEWTVMAVSPGTATIVAAGSPACAGQDGCTGGQIAFRTTITVEG